MSDSAFKIHALELGPMENFVYLVEDIASRRCAVVDPAWEVERIVNKARELELRVTDILLTHSHHDHINGIEELLNHASAEVHLLKPEYEFWQHELEKPSLHHGGDELELGTTRIKILHTPGHTPGSACYQLGNEITRTLGHMDHLGFESSEEAWGYRTQLGVRGGSMAGAFSTFGREAAMRTFADWTDRIAAGEVPDQPPRPEGVERNVVLTLWDWGVDTSFMHDEIATDKNDPTVNAWGPLYAVSSGHGKLTVLDPVDNDSWEIIIPTREDAREVSSRFPPPAVPSNFWGDEHLWGPEHPSDPHNPMLDRKGRVWMTSKE